MVSRAAPSEQTQALVLFVPDDPQSQVPELLAVPAFPSNSPQSPQDEPIGLLELPQDVTNPAYASDRTRPTEKPQEELTDPRITKLRPMFFCYHHVCLCQKCPLALSPPIPMMVGVTRLLGRSPVYPRHFP